MPSRFLDSLRKSSFRRTRASSAAILGLRGGESLERVKNQSRIQTTIGSATTNKTPPHESIFETEAAIYSTPYKQLHSTMVSSVLWSKYIMIRTPKPSRYPTTPLS